MGAAAQARAFWSSRPAAPSACSETRWRPVAIAFAVLQLGGGGAELGLVLAARGIPHVLLLLVGRVLSDRYSRQRVLVLPARTRE